MERREFLTASAMVGLGLGLEGSIKGLAQQPAAPAMGGHKIPHRQAKTTRLFKSPGLYPNALAVAPEGLWIGQQKLDAETAASFHKPVPTDKNEAAWLVDWNGKLLKTVITESRNTSGMAYGDGCVWMVANTDPEGVFQTNMDSKLVRHLQIPLGPPPPGNGGGSHGAQWHNGKLWIVANRMRGNLRVDPKTWTPELFFPIYTTPEMPRWHDMTFDDQGYIWQVNGNATSSYASGKQGLIKYDGENGRVLELVELVPGSCDPHGLEFHHGALISCDSGEHPGWPGMDSPSSGWIFRIDLL